MIIAIITGIIGGACYWLGFNFGVRRGKAIGWLEKYFADYDKELARRDEIGRFKAREERRG